MEGIEAAFCGILSTDPVLKTGKNGKPYANFSCTVSNEGGDPSWLNVICFNEAAENIAKRAKKGATVYCEGILSLASWTDSEGKPRSGLAVSATKVERLGLNGRNRPDENKPPLPSLPIALPARKRPAFGMFRRKKKAQEPAETAQVSSDSGRPFDDPLDF
jgi:single stranded DNA-binding protein